MAGLSGVVQSNKPLLQAGKMRHRIQIVEPTLTQDSMGGWSVNDNVVLLTTWASIDPLTAAEKFAAHEFSESVSHKVWIRDPRSALPGGIGSNMQVWFDTRQFQIVGVLRPTEVSYAICLMCVEINQSKNQTTASPSESSI